MAQQRSRLRHDARRHVWANQQGFQICACRYRYNRPSTSWTHCKHAPSVANRVEHISGSRPNAWTNASSAEVGIDRSGGDLLGGRGASASLAPSGAPLCSVYVEDVPEVEVPADDPDVRVPWPVIRVSFCFSPCACVHFMARDGCPMTSGRHRT